MADPRYDVTVIGAGAGGYVAAIRHGLEKGVLSADDDMAELRELTSGGKHGRGSDIEITICDLTGVGVQDTAIALLASRHARERGFGLQIGS